MIKKIFLFSLVFLLFTVSLPSCAKSEPIPCRELLEGMIDAEIGLPAGRIYDMRAKEGEDEHLPERVINSLFGDGDIPILRSCWLDAALFLSIGTEPCELAVILCDSPEGAADTARMLLRRLDLIRMTFSDGKHSSRLDEAGVTVISNYALLVISSDGESAIKAVKALIRTGK